MPFFFFLNEEKKTEKIEQNPIERERERSRECEEGEERVWFIYKEVLVVTGDW